MKQTKISKAIILAITGAVLTVGAVSTASATGLTMYNSWNAGNHNGTDTDGWTHTNGIPNFGAIQSWEGTVGNARPLGYVGDAHLNWAVTVDANDSVQISTADATTRYSLDADIDTAAGAWLDTENPPQGWKHQTDIGLFQSSVTQLVTLTPTSIVNPNPDLNNFGFTIFEGQATPQVDEFGDPIGYSHHGPWNKNSLNPAIKPIGAEDPWMVGVGALVTFDQTVDGANPLSFVAQAGQTYSIYLGGSGGIHWNAQIEGYSLDITTSAVPLPGAVWLMGSALMGMVSFSRRKNTVA